MRRPRLPKDTSEALRWYERYVSPLSLIAGFLLDNFVLLKRVDDVKTNLLLGTYLFIAGAGILLINAAEAGRIRSERFMRILPYIPIAVQFSFGGLFSGYLSLYSRSAGFLESWVFVVLLAAFLIGNERFTRLYKRISFQIPLYFFVLVSFLAFSVPIAMQQFGDFMFVTSMILAISCIALFVYFIIHTSRAFTNQEMLHSFFGVGGLATIITILYFTNLIPPLPLALKDSGIYHAITRDDQGGYHLQGEQSDWYLPYLFYRDTFHTVSSDVPIYAYAAIFAPTGISANIMHEWKHYNPATDEWDVASIIKFPINGGRDGGYRGYTIKYGASPGLWRVDVLTETGRRVGRISFDVVMSSTSPQIVETIK